MVGGVGAMQIAPRENCVVCQYVFGVTTSGRQTCWQDVCKESELNRIEETRTRLGKGRNDGLMRVGRVMGKDATRGRWKKKNWGGSCRFRGLLLFGRWDDSSGWEGPVAAGSYSGTDLDKGPDLRCQEGEEETRLRWW